MVDWSESPGRSWAVRIFVVSWNLGVEETTGKAQPFLYHIHLYTCYTTHTPDRPQDTAENNY